eukprot:gene24802-31182_t
MIFHTCGICDREFGLKHMVLLSDISWEITHSSLGAKCEVLKRAGRDLNNEGNYSKQKTLLILMECLCPMATHRTLVLLFVR